MTHYIDPSLHNEDGPFLIDKKETFAFNPPMDYDQLLNRIQGHTNAVRIYS